MDKYDVGHAPHYYHRIQSTMDAPIFVPQFKVPISDEKALYEMLTHAVIGKSMAPGFAAIP